MDRTWNRRALLTVAAATLPMATFLGSAAGSRFAQGRDLKPSREIRFKDLAGNEIVLSHPARRIADLWTTGAAFAIAAHGSSARLVAVNNLAHSIFQRGLIGRLYPEVLDIPSDVMVGNMSPNIERLVSLDPDIVVDMRDDPRDLAAAMRSAGLTVARYGKVPGGLPETIKALLLLFGEMIGDTSRAERIIAAMNAALERLAGVQAMPHAARPRVLLVMHSAGRFYASGGKAGGLYSDFIYMAGGVNVAADLPGFSEVSAEQIVAWDPDVVLLFQSEDAHPASILAHPVLGGGRAAVARRVHIVPIGANNWGSLGPDEFLFPVWLAELLYPDRVERKLRQDMRVAYAAIFDRAFSDEELDDVLRLDLNGSSASYMRFFRDA